MRRSTWRWSRSRGRISTAPARGSSRPSPRARSDQGVHGVAHILLIAAALHAAAQHLPAAARLHGAAEAQLQHSGLRIEPTDMASLAPILAKVRPALEADAYAQAFAAGRALDQAAILSLVADCLPRATT